MDYFSREIIDVVLYISYHNKRDFRFFPSGGIQSERIIEFSTADPVPAPTTRQEYLYMYSDRYQ